jgi:hypothetical protein
MYHTGNECDVSPYTEAYKAIKSVPIVQAAIAYDNRDTDETTLLILNEAIWMGDQMEHTLINPNQLRAYGITVHDNPFDLAPIFISTEDDEFTLPLNSKGTVLGVATRTPTDQELQTCPVGSTECSVPESLTNCGGGDFQDSRNCYDSRRSFYQRSRQ